MLFTSVVLLGAVSGTTLSNWTESDTGTGGVITSGELDLVIDAPVWSVIVSSGDTPTVINPDTYLATPGDTFIITQEFTPLLDGENLNSELTMEWVEAPSLPVRTAATYRILDGNDTELQGSTNVGTNPTDLRFTPDQLSTAGDSVKLEITLQYGRTKANLMEPTIETADLGRMSIELAQIRTGSGFN